MEILKTFDKNLNISIKKYILFVFNKLYNCNSKFYKKEFYKCIKYFFDIIFFNYIYRAIFNQHSYIYGSIIWDCDPLKFINVFIYLQNSNFTIYLIKKIIRYYNNNYEFNKANEFMNNLSLYSILRNYVYIKIKSKYLEEFTNFKIIQNRKINLKILKQKFNNDISLKIIEYI